MPGDINKIGLTMFFGHRELRLYPPDLPPEINMVCLGTDTFNGKQFARVGIPVTLIGYAMMLKLFAATCWRWLGWI
ncbi:anion permease [Cupriavidus basilensis]